MPIVRTRHVFDAAFTQIPNAWLRDKRLSLKAKGLLAQLMSHAPGWNVSIKSLAEANDCGLDAIRTAVQELEAAGYLKRSQERGSEGQFAEVTWLTCDPSEKPSSENPMTDNPSPKNTSVKNNNSKNNERTLAQASLERFDEFWKAYPRKAGKQAAIRAWPKALKLADAERIIAGAKSYADDPNRKDAFTAHAATWLNAGRWDDEPLPERELTPEEKAEKARIEREQKRAAEIERSRIEREEAERQREQIRLNPPKQCEHERIIFACRICAPKVLEELRQVESEKSSTKAEGN